MARNQGGIAISFDEENRIRILESEHFRKTETLADESNNFVQSASIGKHVSRKFSLFVQARSPALRALRAHSHANYDCLVLLTRFRNSVVVF